MLRKIALAVVCLIWLGPHAFAAVAFDAKGTAACDASAATITCSTLTIGGGSNSALVALVGYDATLAVTNPTFAVTWNGTTMALAGAITNTNTSGGEAIFCLAAPASGNHALVVTGTGNLPVELHVIGVSFTGVNQTTPCAHFNSIHDSNGSGGALTAITNTITTVAGDVAIADYGNGQIGPGSNPNLNGTPITAYGTDFNGPNYSFEANYNTASGTSTALTDTGSGTATDWVSAGVDVQASSAPLSAKSTMIIDEDGMFVP